MCIVAYFAQTVKTKLVDLTGLDMASLARSGVHFLAHPILAACISFVACKCGSLKRTAVTCRKPRFLNDATLRYCFCVAGVLLRTALSACHWRPCPFGRDRRPIREVHGHQQLAERARRDGYATEVAQLADHVL